MAEPLDEEPLDRWVNRQLARPVTWALIPLPITANQVTLLAALCGIAAGLAFTREAHGWRLAALGFAWAALILDCADGQLARARGGGSPLGYLLDGVGDYVIATALHAGLIAAAFAAPEGAFLGKVPAILVIALSGAAMAVHSNAFEAVKFRYKTALGADPGQHLERQEKILRTLEEEQGILARCACAGLSAYQRGQRKLNEASAGMTVGRTAFLLATLLGPTLRLSLLAASACAAAWWPGALWVYPASSLVFANLVYLGLRLTRSI